jgi:Tail-tube assembly protein
MPLNVGAPIGSEAYTTAATQNAYANAYGSANVATGTATNNGPYQLRYPRNRLDNTADYLEIKIFDYVAGEFDFGPPLTSKTAQQRLKPKQNSPKGYVFLPIPQNVSDSVSVTWGDSSINPFEAFVVGGVSNLIEGGGSIDTNKAIQSIKDAQNISPEFRKAALGYFAAKATNIAGGNVSPQSLIARTTGQVVNSNLELIFQGINLRQFQFTFDMAPRSSNEAQEVKQIIRTFKREMSARSGGAGSGSNSNVGLFITAPSLFQLTYKSGPRKHPFLNTFKPCALTDVAVNYTASGTYATYADASPVHIQMGLTFKEIDPVYSEDYNFVEEGVGY